MPLFIVAVVVPVVCMSGVFFRVRIVLLVLLLKPDQKCRTEVCVKEREGEK